MVVREERKMEKFIFEFAGWVFGTMAVLGFALPFYGKFQDKKAEAKAKEYREANKGYYEHIAKLAGVDVALVG